MTTWENTDSIERVDNLTITSDTAYERVTSDLKMEDERDWWYLKQNTAWLVQEIPNISFLDIADTMLESKKTLSWRANWNVVVGSAGKSIEVIPQDIITLKMDESVIYDIFPAWIEFGDSIVSWDTTMTLDSDDNWKIKILQDWYYKISYWWTIDPGTNTAFSIWVWNIVRDEYDWGSYGTMMSWWRSISNVYLEEWDYVYLDILASDDVTVYQDYTYLEIQFQQYKL